MKRLCMMDSISINVISTNAIRCGFKPIIYKVVSCGAIIIIAYFKIAYVLREVHLAVGGNNSNRESRCFWAYVFVTFSGPMYLPT